MKQKIFLTSALAMGVIAPAIAEPSNTGEFPTGGLMQEDYTYTNAATSDNMDGVYSGTVNAVAEYDIIDYIVNAGQYLPADSETVITCPAGSYCPGISGNVQYNQTTAQGIQTCPTGYASSAAGASSDTQCYRQCSGNVTIEHATGVTGNDYYGNGTDTCEPTGCVAGWHIKQGLNLATEIGTIESNDYAYIADGGRLVYDGMNSGISHIAADYGLNSNDHNKWARYYPDKGMLYGQARCSTRDVAHWWFQTRDNNGNYAYLFENDHFVSNLVDETGQEGAQNCYCNVTGYKPDGGSLQSLSSSWVFIDWFGGGSEDCAVRCIQYCHSQIGQIEERALRYRTTLLGTVAPGLASCDANTITINWNDVDPEYAGQNNEGTATYGSDVRTPVKAQTKKGQRFKGWRFSKPTETNLPE